MSRIMQRLDALAADTDEPGRISRFFLTPSHRAAIERVRGWMREAGMTVTLDAAANLVGRYGASRADAPTLLIGSHIDTVRDAGRYDGALGIVVAIEAVARLNEGGRRLPFAIEVLAFGDEEGVRFPATLTGSRAIAGCFDPSSLAARDRDGASVAEALTAFGCDPAAIAALARPPQAVLGFLEVHIEQGPVLQSLDLPVGLVSAIAGATRAEFFVEGTAGHAGTTPMNLRRDAFAAAAEMAMAIEATARARRDVVATIGQIAVEPGGVNVIPGAARFSLDLRSPADAERDGAFAAIGAACEAIAGRRNVSVRVATRHQSAAAPCDPALTGVLANAIARRGLAVQRLPSGAGHDAMVFPPRIPIAMLFVRCKDGISHNPAESITAADAEIAVDVLLDALEALGTERRDVAA
jgi:allantoate deiminase